MGTWDITAVIDFSELLGILANFEQELTGWDTSSVTNMFAMFNNAANFNQALPFDTRSVSAPSNAMRSMFNGANMNFNQPLAFDTSSVDAMASMFYSSGTNVFNAPLLFDTSSVIDMGSIFYGAYTFNQFLSWDLASVTNI